MFRSSLSSIRLVLLHSVDTSSSISHDLDEWNDQRMQEIRIARRSTGFFHLMYKDPILQCRVGLVSVFQGNLKS